VRDTGVFKTNTINPNKYQTETNTNAFGNLEFASKSASELSSLERQKTGKVVTMARQNTSMNGRNTSDIMTTDRQSNIGGQFGKR